MVQLYFQPRAFVEREIAIGDEAAAQSCAGSRCSQHHYGVARQPSPRITALCRQIERVCKLDVSRGINAARAAKIQPRRTAALVTTSAADNVTGAGPSMR